jgi:DNA primase large subunit
MMDYEKTYTDFWKDIIEKDNGEIDMDALKRELHDYHVALDQVTIVYCHITGGRISKINTTADAVIQEADEYYEKTATKNMIQNTIKEECAMWEKRFNEQTAIAVVCHEKKVLLQSEIETVTQWLDSLNIPDKEESGVDIGWMRRVAIALNIQPHSLPQTAAETA